MESLYQQLVHHDRVSVAMIGHKNLVGPPLVSFTVEKNHRVVVMIIGLSDHHRHVASAATDIAPEIERQKDMVGTEKDYVLGPHIAEHVTGA